MTTISVPLSADLLRALEALVRQGVAPNKAEAMRLALKKYVEDKEVEEILQASREPSLDGDLEDLLQRLT